MGRKPQKRNSQMRTVTAPEKPKAPRILSSWKELFNDDGFDVGKCISLLLTGLSKTEEAIALQALIAWIFLAPSPSSAARSQTIVKQAMLIRAALRLDRKCIRNPSLKIIRSMKLFQELHREADAKWLLESIFLPLGGFDELVKCKAINSLKADMRKRLKHFATVLPLVSILHCAALSARTQSASSEKLSLAQAISTYRHDDFNLSSFTYANYVDSQDTDSESSPQKELGPRQLKVNWAGVKDQIGFFYAAHFVQMKSGLTVAHHIAKFGLSKPIEQETLVKFLGVARAFHETVLDKMTNAGDWHIEFPTTLPSVDFSIFPTFTEQHQTVVLNHFVKKKKLVVDSQM